MSEVKKGISTWLFSKIVMLIFLVITFSIVLSFSAMIKEKMYADSASVLAMRVRDGVQSVVLTDALQAKTVIALPEYLPDDINMKDKRKYTILIGEDSSGLLYVAVGWGKDPKAFAGAASMKTSGLSVRLPGSSCSFPVRCYSDECHYVLVTKIGINEIGINMCRNPECTGVSVMTCS